MENSHYNKKLRKYSHDLRSNMTKAEACLWKYALRAGHMKGYTFRRQRPVLNYMADFMCLKLKLVIEVDGATHDIEETVERDNAKQKALENEGYYILRFTDEEVLKSMNSVIVAIEDFIKTIESDGAFK